MAKVRTYTVMATVVMSLLGEGDVFGEMSALTVPFARRCGRSGATSFVKLRSAPFAAAAAAGDFALPWRLEASRLWI